MASISDYFYRVSRGSEELSGYTEHAIRYILKFQEYGVDSGSTAVCITAADKYQDVLYFAQSMLEEDGSEDFYEERIDAINDAVKYFKNIQDIIQEARDEDEMCEEDYFSDDGAISSDEDDDGQIIYGCICDDDIFEVLDTEDIM